MFRTGEFLSMCSILFVNLGISAGFGEKHRKQLACVLEANNN